MEGLSTKVVRIQADSSYFKLGRADWAVRMTIWYESIIVFVMYTPCILLEDKCVSGLESASFSVCTLISYPASNAKI